MHISYQNAEGKEISSHFGCSTNIGLGATTARYANKLRRYLGDTLGTGLALLYAVATHAPMKITLEIEGKTETLHDVNHLAILKNPYIASGLKLNLPITQDDGMLQLFAIHSRGRFGIINSFPKFYSGKIVEAENTYHAVWQSATIHTTPQCEIEFDGDPRGHTPITVKILPKALRLIGGNHA